MRRNGAFFPVWLFGRNSCSRAMGRPLEPHDCTLMKLSQRSHPLCPRRPKSVTSALWRQVWPLHRYPSGNSIVVTGSNWTSSIGELLRHSGGRNHVRGFFIHPLRFSAEFLVMSPQPLFGLQGSSVRGLRRPALALAVLAHVQHVSRCVLRLPVRRSITCFLLRCQHAWRLQSTTTGVPLRGSSQSATLLGWSVGGTGTPDNCYRFHLELFRVQV